MFSFGRFNISNNTKCEFITIYIAQCTMQCVSFPGVSDNDDITIVVNKTFTAHYLYLYIPIWALAHITNSILFTWINRYIDVITKPRSRLSTFRIHGIELVVSNGTSSPANDWCSEVFPMRRRVVIVKGAMIGTSWFCRFDAIMSGI